jgi:uncharacterized small protein (DUF1192 family)
MVTVESLASQIKSLEAQIAILKGQFKQLLAAGQPESMDDLDAAVAHTGASSEDRRPTVSAISTIKREETLTIAMISSRIKGLDAEIAVLKAAIERLDTRPSVRIKTFGDLYGILADAGDITEEEIDAVLYRIDEDDEKLFGAPE